MRDSLRLYRLSKATFYDRINTVYHFIKPFLDKKCLFWRNMEPLIYSEGQRLNLKVPFKRAAGIILDFLFFFFLYISRQHFSFFLYIFFRQKNIINNLHVLAQIGMETKPQTLLNKTPIQVMLEDNITRKKEEKNKRPTGHNSLT